MNQHIHLKPILQYFTSCTYSMLPPINRQVWKRTCKNLLSYQRPGMYGEARSRNVLYKIPHWSKDAYIKIDNVLSVKYVKHLKYVLRNWKIVSLSVFKQNGINKLPIDTLAKRLPAKANIHKSWNQFRFSDYSFALNIIEHLSKQDMTKALQSVFSLLASV